MRGDSIRDLYAKTAALAGLAVLAGIGALVDYWPVGVTPPSVATLALPAPQVAVVVSPGLERVPVVLARAERPALPALAVMADAPVPVGESIALAALLAPAPAPTPAVVDAEPIETRATEPVAEPVPFTVGPDFDPALVYQMGAEDEAGFLADAVDIMKTTGSTIKRGGAITGAGIVSAFRAVSGAFRKIKLF